MTAHDRSQVGSSTLPCYPCNSTIAADRFIAAQYFIKERERRHGVVCSSGPRLVVAELLSRYPPPPPFISDLGSGDKQCFT